MSKKRTVSFDEAIEMSLSMVSSKPQTQWVSLFDALGRTLAKDITCKKNLPSYNNAAMDGFAFKHHDCGKTLGIKQTILAGDVVEASLGENECYKIMTGAKVPADVDTIIPFEDCVAYDEKTVCVPQNVKKGNALRLKGEEQTIGNVLLHEGSIVTSTVIAMLASQGIVHVEVYCKLRITVFSTGNELKKPWESAHEDEIYDVNALALIALLAEFGFEADYGGVIPDNLESATDYLSQMKKYDVLVTSGGISMGEADFVEEALHNNGLNTLFHGINIKPGKPTMMGKMGETIVASMPGNPLAAYVNAFLLLIPLLKKLQGQKNFNFQYSHALNQTAFKVKSGRVNIVLGRLENDKFYVFDNNKYGSGMITPLLYSDAVLISNEPKSDFNVTESIKILPFKAVFSNVKASFKN